MNKSDPAVEVTLFDGLLKGDDTRDSMSKFVFLFLFCR